jgi:restriction system protein
VWNFAHFREEPPAPLLWTAHCAYCGTVLTRRTWGYLEYGLGDQYTWSVALCLTCGWWSLGQTAVQKIAPHSAHRAVRRWSGAVACLQEMGRDDLQAPLELIRSHLMRRYQDRFDVHPRRFEEVVGSVFRDLGYDSVVSAYTGDGGVDVILTREQSRIGVQVKRYRGTIEVEQIRTLVGALYLGGYTSGVFVTTSRFSRGAVTAAAHAAEVGIPVRLIDAAKFLDALKFAQIEASHRILRARFDPLVLPWKQRFPILEEEEGTFGELVLAFDTLASEPPANLALQLTGCAGS